MVTNSYIRLTPDDQSRMGALWNSIVRSVSMTCSFLKGWFSYVVFYISAGQHSELGVTSSAENTWQGERLIW